MLNDKRNKIIWIVLAVAFLGYFFLSLSFLCRFPYVHSDEAWLSGLTRAMSESGNLAVTEPFFNLKERWPHGIKIIFHLLQMIALKIGGYEIASFRLVSLLVAMAALALFYLAARRFCRETFAPLAALALLAFDVQFIYASHMARQEILILLAICACLAILGRGRALGNKDCLALALITGAAVGVHPNAFIVACMCGVVLVVQWALHRVGWRQLLLYTGVTGAMAGIFVLISFAFDSQFILHYATYAQNEFGMNLSLLERIGEAASFQRKLFAGISGTYYLPELRPQLFIFSSLGLLLAVYTLVMRKEQPDETARAATLLGAAAGGFLGIVLIGRYNQLSIVFLFPSCWLIVVYTLRLFGAALFRTSMAILLVIVIACSYTSIRPWLQYEYDEYLSEFEENIPAGSITLGNLNSEYAFAAGQLLDYRNLAYLDENSMDIAAYVEAYDIDYIVWSDELSYIDENRPYWNRIYGNFDIAALKTYINTDCELVWKFKNPTYGVRIVGLLNNENYGNIEIYRVKR